MENEEFELIDQETENVNLEDQPVKQLIERIEAKDISLSFSAIKAFMKSPRHFLAYKLKTVKQTPAMLFGDLIDCLILTPDDTESRFFVLSDKAGYNSHDALDALADSLKVERNREWKVDERRAYLRGVVDALDVPVVSAETFKRANEIVSDVVKNESVAWIMENIGHTQKDVEFSAFGWNWRGRMDGFGDILITDLKLMVTAEPAKAQRTIENEAYDVQAAIYTIGAGYDKPFYFTCFDRAGHSSVHQIGRGRLLVSWERLEKVMEYFERCRVFNEWHKSYDFWAGNGGIYVM